MSSVNKIEIDLFNDCIMADRKDMAEDILNRLFTSTQKTSPVRDSELLVAFTPGTTIDSLKRIRDSLIGLKRYQPDVPKPLRDMVVDPTGLNDMMYYYFMCLIFDSDIKVLSKMFKLPPKESSETDKDYLKRCRKVISDVFDKNRMELIRFIPDRDRVVLSLVERSNYPKLTLDEFESLVAHNPGKYLSLLGSIIPRMARHKEMGVLGFSHEETKKMFIDLYRGYPRGTTWCPEGEHPTCIVLEYFRAKDYETVKFLIENGFDSLPLMYELYRYGGPYYDLSHKEKLECFDVLVGNRPQSEYAKHTFFWVASSVLVKELVEFESVIDTKGLLSLIFSRGGTNNSSLRPVLELLRKLFSGCENDLISKYFIAYEKYGLRTIDGGHDGIIIDGMMNGIGVEKFISVNPCAMLSARISLLRMSHEDEASLRLSTVIEFDKSMEPILSYFKTHGGYPTELSNPGPEGLRYGCYSLISGFLRINPVVGCEMLAFLLENDAKISEITHDDSYPTFMSFLSLLMEAKIPNSMMVVLEKKILKDHGVYWLNQCKKEADIALSIRISDNEYESLKDVKPLIDKHNNGRLIGSKISKMVPAGYKINVKGNIVQIRSMSDVIGLKPTN